MTRPTFSVVQSDGTFIPATSEFINVGSKSETPINRLSTEDLYPSVDDRPSSLNASLSLLHETETFLHSALSSTREDDLIGADDAMTKFQVTLPELFCCREVGDGFALAVSSLFHAVGNATEIPFSEGKILALIFVVRFLRKNIFCSIETAVDVSDKLLSAGFDTNPPAMTEIAELLGG